MKNVKYIAVGDIQSSGLQLKAGFEHVLNIYNPEKIIFLGDNFDRGETANIVLSTILKIKSKYDCVFLEGNHDSLLKEALVRKNITSTYQLLGGVQTIQQLLSYFKGIGRFQTLENDKISFLAKQPELVEWLNLMTFLYEDENYLFSHSPIYNHNDHINYDNWNNWQSDDVFSNATRYLDFAEYLKSISKINVCGHTQNLTTNQVRVYSQHIFLDTGAPFGPLSFVMLNDKTVEAIHQEF